MWYDVKSRVCVCLCVCYRLTTWQTVFNYFSVYTFLFLRLLVGVVVFPGWIPIIIYLVWFVLEGSFLFVFWFVHFPC